MTDRDLFVGFVAINDNDAVHSRSLADAIRAVDSPWVAIGKSSGSAQFETSKQQITNILKTVPENVAGVLVEATPSTRNGRRGETSFPPLLATLVGEPNEGWLPVIRKSLIQGDLSFRDVRNPLWDWFIRAAIYESVEIRLRVGNKALESRGKESALPELAPAPPARHMGWLEEHLTSVQPKQLVSAVRSKADAVALKAGLLQIHDFLDASHEQSQSIEGEGVHRSGDYWHAIHHRREPDYGNSKYWFYQVGKHPIFDKLAGRAHRILAESESNAGRDWEPRLVSENGWNPFGFVEMCETAAGSKDEGLIDVAKRIQMAEMQLLLAQTYLDATGDASIR